MALMRTSRNGEPPGKKNQEIKVTAKTPYGVSAQTGGKVKLKGVSLKESEDKYTPEKANIEYEKAIKGGGMVSIYDKSVDPTTRKLVLGSIGSSDPLGKRTDIAIEKGYKASSYKDIYGVDFNPEEFRAASKGKDFDKYLKEKGLSAGQSFVPKFGYLGKYETESDRKKQKETEIEQFKKEVGDPSKLKLSKLPLLKPGKISAKTTGRIRETERQAEEKPTFVNPSRPLVSVESRFTAKSGKEKARTPISKAVENVKRKAQYAKEGKQFKAYYGAPSSISASERSGMTAEDLGKEKVALKGVKKELKADIKSNKPGSTISRSELRAELKNVKKDIRSIGKAQKYAAGNIEARSVYDSGKEETVVRGKKDGAARYWKPEYGDQYSAYSRSQQASFRSSTDNAVNKNKTFGRKESNPKRKP